MNDRRPVNLTVRDLTHRDTLRSTAAMIQGRWPGRYSDLASRLEELAHRIACAQLDEPLCELPHQSVEEEDACEQRRLTGKKDS